MRVGVGAVIEFNHKCTLPDVGRDALEMEGLVPSPTEEYFMRRGELAKASDHALISKLRLGLRSRTGHLLIGVFANHPMRRPSSVLAFY